jgi:hypothetical protein
VTRHGHDAVVVLSAVEYRRLTRAAPDLKAFLLAGPDLSPLELEATQRDLPGDLEL